MDETRRGMRKERRESGKGMGGREGQGGRKEERGGKGKGKGKGGDGEGQRERRHIPHTCQPK
jgi:hypothetical protein